jgi:NADH dehydrogenase [ubiquinone] 1 alpha subcomplex assembly factor 1
MEGAELPNRGPRLLYSFNTPTETSEVVLGCDADIGGFSTVNFTLDTESESERIGRPTAKFHGNLRLDVRPELVGRINAGYAGFKTEVGAGTTSCKKLTLDIGIRHGRHCLEK